MFNKASTAEIDFKVAYRLEPLQVIEAVKSNLPVQTLANVAARMGITSELLCKTLGLRRTTTERRVREDKVLTPGEGSLLLGIARLVGQVQVMVEESGRTEGFDAPQCVAKWLEEPMPALNGRRPAEYMDTPEGQAIVANLVARAQSGTYA